MEYRRLGASGLKVSALSFGSWVTFGDQIDTERAAECMQIAYDHGVNFFDNAEAYAGGQSERMMGQIIQDKDWTRSDLVVSTKIFWGGEGPNDLGLSRKHVVEGTTAALERLQMDYVDLVFCHRPDLETPIAETVRAMSYLVENGYAFYWGTSQWSAEQIRHAYEVARREHLIPPTMEQPQYNMFCRERVEREYASLYDDVGLGTTIWSPLASGLLTGKYNDGIPDDSRLATEGYEWLQDQVLVEEPPGDGGRALGPGRRPRLHDGTTGAGLVPAQRGREYRHHGGVEAGAGQGEHAGPRCGGSNGLGRGDSHRVDPRQRARRSIQLPPSVSQRDRARLDGSLPAGTVHCRITIVAERALEGTVRYRADASTSESSPRTSSRYEAPARTRVGAEEESV